MRRFILGAVVVLAAFIISPATTLALPPPNGFECVAVGPVPRCQPNTNTANCSPGNVPDDSVCTIYNGNAGLCNNAGGTCIAAAQSPSNTHTCTFTGSQLKCGPANTDCQSGYMANSAYCDNFDNNPGNCNSAPPTACIAASQSPPDPQAGCASGEINTAIGCIPVSNSDNFIGFILRWAIGIGGGIAFLLIIVAGFQIMTSSGNPERLKAGQELLTSAITGIILLIFSVFILELIGVHILKIPGFGT